MDILPSYHILYLIFCIENKLKREVNCDFGALPYGCIYGPNFTGHFYFSDCDFARHLYFLKLMIKVKGPR